MKEEKIGLTTTNWILSILGILLLSSLIILPPIFRVVFKEEEKQEIKDEIIIEKITCEKKNIISATYREDINLVFYYYKDRIRTYSKSASRTYNDYILYESDKQKFGRYVTNFSLLTGYTYSIDPDDEMPAISISEEYDLGVFKSTTITIPGENEEVTVTTAYTNEDSMNKIKNDLINDGYTCK